MSFDFQDIAIQEYITKMDLGERETLVDHSQAQFIHHDVNGKPGKRKRATQPVHKRYVSSFSTAKEQVENPKKSTKGVWLPKPIRDISCPPQVSVYKWTEKSLAKRTKTKEQNSDKKMMTGNDEFVLYIEATGIPRSNREQNMVISLMNGVEVFIDSAKKTKDLLKSSVTEIIKWAKEALGFTTGFQGMVVFYTPENILRKRGAIMNIGKLYTRSSKIAGIAVARIGEREEARAAGKHGFRAILARAPLVDNLWE
ncbi:hypothetical protein ABW20_dc0100449 [Dactylellina cionopaga]|nr:hypothetical protein ABW20_dc0100449 [Dactylellina cionopaga]